MCHCLLHQPDFFIYLAALRLDKMLVVNHAIDEWRHRLSACVDAEGGLDDCYSQNNNVKMATL